MADEVIQVELIVINDQGLHFRPASQLVKTANQFESRIELVLHDQRVNAKSMIEILTLVAEKGTLLTLEAQGDDARDAAHAIENLFKEGFDDDEPVTQTARN